MMAIRCSRIAGFASVVVLTLAAASARADIFAATCVRDATGTQGIAIVNATLGTPVALPSSVNTIGDEYHPSITKDGRRLLFQRHSYPPPSPRELVVVDLVTGESATLFTRTFSEFGRDPFFGAAIRPEGSYVVTGRNFNSTQATVWISSLSAGFSRITRTGFYVTDIDFRAGGRVFDVAVGGPAWIAMHIQESDRDELLLVQRGVGSSSPLSDALFEYSQPAMAADNPQTVVFRSRRVVNMGGVKRYFPGELQYRPAALASFAGTPTTLAVGSIYRDESQPSLTPDGRYLAFVSDAPNFANDRLFVWDSQTQTLLNPGGVDLGLTFTARRGCSTSLYTRPVIASSVILGSGFVNASLVQSASIGIFVQRIVGKKKVLGRKTYELETVGRVPLGSYGAGNVFTHWDFAVGGEPLVPGKYLVTVRAVEGDVVRELGESQVLRIDENGRAHIRDDARGKREDGTPKGR